MGLPLPLRLLFQVKHALELPVAPSSSSPAYPSAGPNPTHTVSFSCALSNVKKVSLELGGKSPLIIFADCDLSKAVQMVRAGLWGEGANREQCGEEAFSDPSVKLTHLT